MDKLAAMHAFRRVVERASFSKAAEELGLSPAGIGKQVRWLEQELHAALLLRTTRTMRLTDTGRAYYQECCRLLDELDELERAGRHARARTHQCPGIAQPGRTGAAAGALHGPVP